MPPSQAPAAGTIILSEDTAPRVTPPTSPTSSGGTNETVEVRTKPRHHPLPTLAVTHVQPSVSLPVEDAYVEDAKHAVERYEAMLGSVTDAAARGRIHYEMARLFERIHDDGTLAREHYQKARAQAPDYLPALVSLRRLAVEACDHLLVVQLLDEELRVTSDRNGRVALLLEKGRVLADHLAQPDEARAALLSASEVAGPDLRVFKALEQLALPVGDWDALVDVLGHQANALAQDRALRAGVLCRQARIYEIQGADPTLAISSYQRALEDDPRSTEAFNGLKRLYSKQQRWRELAAIHELEATSTENLREKALCLHRAGIVLLDSVGDRDGARVVLERAAELRPAILPVLHALKRVYEDGGDMPGVVGVLDQLAAMTSNEDERLGYFHQIGLLRSDALRDDDGAIEAFESALAVDAAHIPTLRALALLYARRHKWDRLVAMHIGEAHSAREKSRRAHAHARAAAVLEREGRIDESVAQYERALTLVPDQHGIFAALVRLYDSTGRYHQLVELYERHLEAVETERRIEFLFAIGDLYRGPLTDPAQAEHAYRRILRVNGRHLGAIHAWQRVSETGQRWESLVEALEFEAAIVADKSAIVDLMFRCGEVLEDRIGRREDAIARFRDVVAIDPGHRPTLAMLGRIYYEIGRWDELAKIFELELACTTDPVHTVVLLHKLGDLYVRSLGDADRAIVLFRRALDLAPHHGPSIASLAKVMRSRKKWRDVLTLCELERERSVDAVGRARMSVEMGRIYEEYLENFERAETNFSRAVEEDPGSLVAFDALTRVRERLGHWAELADDLERFSRGTAERQHIVRALIRAGGVARDHLKDNGRAIRCFERALELDAADVAAMVALEGIYRSEAQAERLAVILNEEVNLAEQPTTRAALLGERVRALELAASGDNAERVAAWSAILSVCPRDRIALSRMEQVALRTQDPRMLASVDARLAETVVDPALKASYLTRRAEALEMSGDPTALNVYRDALKIDAENYGALRGLSRLAEVLGDIDAQVEAATAEITVARSPHARAEAQVHLGRLLEEQLGDKAAALDCFDNALQQWPDHELAATRLSAILRWQSKLQLLAERLARAANDATNRSRRQALWIEAAGVYAQDLGNLGAAVAGLERLVEVQSDDTVAMLELARLYVSDRRSEDAVALLSRCVDLTEGEHKADVQMMLGAALEDQGKAAQAFVMYRNALGQRPRDAQVVLRLSRVQLSMGEYEGARESALLLRELAQNPDSIVQASVAMARALHGLGDASKAIDALLDGVVMDSPAGVTSAVLQELITTPDLWKYYARELRTRLERAGATVIPWLYIELSRVLAHRLGDRAGARDVLQRGLSACQADSGLRFELATYLAQDKRYFEAIDHLQVLLMDDVARAEVWRGLAHAYGEVGQPRARQLANVALSVLEVAMADEARDVEAWGPRTAHIRPGSLAGDATLDLLVARDQQVPGAALWAVIVEGLAKVRPPDLSRHGVSSRDRLAPRSEHPIRSIFDQVSGIFGVTEFDLYVHDRSDDRIVIENTGRPSVVVPASLGAANYVDQVFKVAEAIASLSRGVFTIDLFTPREVDILLAAATRAYVPGYGDRVAASDILDEHARTLTRAISRRRRRAHEELAQSYSSVRGPDATTLIQWIRQSSRRIALIVADDLQKVCSCVARLEHPGHKLSANLARQSPVLTDLMRVWLSKPAMAVRYSSGLLPQPQRQVPASGLG